MRRETLLERRERARRLATSIVSVAIMVMGGALLAAAVVLGVRGRLSFILLAFLLGAFAVAVVLGGLFFHLLPSKLDALADEKRDYDRREAAKRDASGARSNGVNGDDAARR